MRPSPRPRHNARRRRPSTLSKDGYTVTVAVVRSRRPAAGRDPRQSRRHAYREDRDRQGGNGGELPGRHLRARDATQAGRPQSGIRSLPNVVAVGGGIVVQAKGALAGGIGVSGAPGGDADEACAKAGLAAISDAIELE